MRVLVFTAVLALSSCSVFSNVRRGNDSDQLKSAAAEASKQAEAMQQAQRDADKKCEHFRTDPVSYVEERFIGQHLAAKLLENDGKPVSDDAITYVAVVGKNLARYSSRPDLPWTFVVIDEVTPRTKSSPGGYVFITTGALKLMTNEAQLAGALAHEIANVCSKRDLTAYIDARHRQCVSATSSKLMLDAGGPSMFVGQSAKYAKDFDPYDLDKSDGSFTAFIMDATMQVMMLRRSDDDFASDAEALRLVSFAGYDAQEFEAYLRSLPATGNSLGGPAPAATRVEKLKALREGDLAGIAVGTAKPPLKVTQ
ncbi:MAG: M48 family metalloprotease [Archangium sp.]